MSGRRAEDGGGRDAGSACRTPRMRQVRLKADSIRFKSPAVIPLSSTEDWYSSKNRLASFSTSARFTCTPFVSFISSFKEATIFFKCSFSRRIALSVAFSSASFMEYLLTGSESSFSCKKFSSCEGLTFAFVLRIIISKSYLSNFPKNSRLAWLDRLRLFLLSIKRNVSASTFLSIKLSKPSLP